MSESNPLEANMALIVEASPNAMLMADAEGKIVLVNAQTEKLFGYPRAELLGQKVEVLVPERLRGQHPGMRRGFFEHPVSRMIGAGRDLILPPGAPVSDPAGIEKHPKRAGSEIGAPQCRTSRGQCQDAPGKTSSPRPAGKSWLHCPGRETNFSPVRGTAAW